MSKTILSSFADNPSLMEEVKAVLIKQFPEPVETEGVSDAILGQQARTRSRALAGIDAAFAEIARLRSRPERPPQENPAR